MVDMLIRFLDDFGPTRFFIGLGALLFLLYGVLYWAFRDEWKELNDRLGVLGVEKEKGEVSREVGRNRNRRGENY